MGGLANEVVIVTGASSGIGAATGRELARRGGRVVLAARRLDQLQAQEEAIVAVSKTCGSRVWSMMWTTPRDSSAHRLR